ncbi:ankyrin repeat-containing domain protein [Trichoderma chlorosporum]
MQAMRTDEAELIKAAMRGHVQGIENLLSTDHHLQRRTTLLKNSSKKVTLNINATDKMGRTALHWIASQGHEHCVDIIMQNPGTTPLVPNKDGRTPLHEAAMKGHMNIVQKFLNYDVFRDRETIDQIDHHKRTALHWAALGGHDAIVEMLVQHGSDITKTSFDEKTVLHSAINAGYDKMKWFLLRTWVTQVDDEGVIRTLLDDNKLEVDSFDENLETLLYYASESGHKGIVTLLVERGASLKGKKRKGQTPLLCAAMKGRDAIVKLLIEKGADIEARERLEGRSPLIFAVENEHETPVKLLLEMGANLETKDQRWRTPLSYAAENGNEAIVRMLVEKGANVNAKATSGYTQLTWAVDKGNNVIERLLVEKGAIRY